MNRHSAPPRLSLRAVIEGPQSVASLVRSASIESQRSSWYNVLTKHASGKARMDRGRESAGGMSGRRQCSVLLSVLCEWLLHGQLSGRHPEGGRLNCR